ncbi:hypothetical protein EB75_27470 [Mycobacterium sp. ST-F2]|uniref:SRPBCC family protein n=1 Tax=Mycobacterium sp. ST-F2 TaxID=1490484 RepID=UPI00093DC60E|nr:SRPBCC domain-containing protein [Mycobacterium sp. ST-F2]OKH78497.1 hypothetical protein EB75_27470 [Mycobacterium sp. ST-F2]
MTDSVTLIRTFDAPQERVYSMFVTPEYFATWFGTDQVDVPMDTFAMDVRIGGQWRAVMHLPDGTLKHWAGSFLELDAPNRVVFDLTDEPDNPDRLPVTVTLRPTAGGTELTLVQPTPGWPAEGRAALEQGYNAFLDSMDRLLQRPPA